MMKTSEQGTLQFFWNGEWSLKERNVYMFEELKYCSERAWAYWKAKLLSRKVLEMLEMIEILEYCPEKIVLVCKAG